MDIRKIRNEEDYETYMAEVEALIMLDPEPESEEAERLEVLSLLIEAYENEKFTFEVPTPVEAILFRMEQQGLRQRDLVPYIGHKSKVSEILSGKRTLTLPMIRKLNENLGIPLKSLVAQEKKNHSDDQFELDYSKFPLDELAERDWLKNFASETVSSIKEFMKPVIPLMRGSFYRKSSTPSDKEDQQSYSVYSWLARLNWLAETLSPSGSFSGVTSELVQEVLSCSTHTDGPIRAMKVLSKAGILLIALKPLKAAKIDGAVFISSSGTPVIGMSLRYDRKDNFWYTLLHELAHLKLHLDNSNNVFVDDLESLDPTNKVERAADEWARDQLIPRSKWRSSLARMNKSESDVIDFSNSLGIDPAIVAGRIRYENDNYQVLSGLVGQGKVRKLFKAKGAFYE